MTLRESIWMVFILAVCVLPADICAKCIDLKEVTDIADKLVTEACNSTVEPYFSYIYFKNPELYIGSSNSLYKVNTRTFQVESRQCIDIVPERKGSITCDLREQEKDVPFVCQNQISVIQQFGPDDWLVCGTNSRRPACWKCNSTTETWNCVLDDGNVEHFVPVKPDWDSTWYFNETSGLMFAGTEVGSHEMPYFSRLHSTYNESDFLQQIVFTNPNHENWLNTPAFVGKPIHRGQYIYFFFRETAVEYKNAGKIIYPRVGRVCADNEGTDKVDALKSELYFQTFVKARLNCSIDLNFPFYFNEIHDIYFDDDAPEIVYAVFTTPREGPPASAVCAYSMAEIENLFDNIGKYKGQTSSSSDDWLPRTHEHLGSNQPFGSCGHKYSSNLVTAIDNYNLIDQLVPNLRNVKAKDLGKGGLRRSDSPLLYYNNYRFSSIVKVDEGGDNDPIVFMIGTSNLRILKAAYNPNMEANEYGSIITEIMLDAVYNESRVNEVRDMITFKEDDATYIIATAISDVFKVPVEFCHTYKTCEDCLRVKDPHCQWNVTKGCIYNGFLVSNHESVDHCPIYRDSVDIDQVKTFGGAQCYSNSTNHTLNFYALLVAKKGSNIQVNLTGIDTGTWNIENSKGVTSNTEFYALRLTWKGMELPENMSIPVRTESSIGTSLNASVIIDASEVATPKSASRIYTYDSNLARYEYSVQQIRQTILKTCIDDEDNFGDVLTCPGFRFQEDSDSFTCPA